jgi:hypothetical protein
MTTFSSAVNFGATDPKKSHYNRSAKAPNTKAGRCFQIPPQLDALGLILFREPLPFTRFQFSVARLRNYGF